MPLLLSHHFSLTQRESSRIHLRTTSDSVIVVRTTFRNCIGAFWEHRYAFSMLAHHRYPEDIIHMFAGRVYKETPLPGLLVMRSINEQRRKKRVTHECA